MNNEFIANQRQQSEKIFITMTDLIRRCTEFEFNIIHEIINDAAQAYKGFIPQDCWHDPYMSKDQLRFEIDNGVELWGLEVEGTLQGVMGIQDKGDVTLFRHAYVRTALRNTGIGTRLLRYLETLGKKPILIGTWTDAIWAIRFYQKNGYTMVSHEEKNMLLNKYWTISERQIETSVVLANPAWLLLKGKTGS